MGEVGEQVQAGEQVVLVSRLDEDIRVGDAIGVSQLLEQGGGPGQLGGTQGCGGQIDELGRAGGTEEPNGSGDDSSDG